MLGPPKPRRLREPIAVSLEDLVPPDHVYRHVERFVVEAHLARVSPSGGMAGYVPMGMEQRTIIRAMMPPRHTSGRIDSSR